MVDVYLVGAALHPAGRHYDKDMDELAAQVLDRALSSAGVDVDVLFVASATAELAERQQILGAYILGKLGLDGVPVYRVENGDGSGGAAVATAYMALRSGMHRCAAVVGVDKPNDVLTNQQQDIYSTTLDTHFERYFGFTPLAQSALMARLYLKKYEYRYEDLAMWAVQMHSNGASNNYAYLRRQIRLEDVVNSEVVSDPLRLYDVGPLADGAAAAVLCAGRKEGPRIAAVASSTNAVPFNARADYDLLYSARRAAEAAYSAAGITPGDVAVAEVHDSFSILGVLAVEALGLAARGGGLAALKDGQLRVNASGGFKSRGNLLGASGVYQLVEVAWQLMGVKPFGKADGNYGVVHSMGGVDRVSTIVVMSL